MRSLSTALLVLVAGCSRAPSPSPPASVAPPVAVSAPPVEPDAAADRQAPPACERPSKRAALVPLEEPVGGGIVLARLGARKVALVADADTKLVHTVDLDAKKELARTRVAGEPSALLVAPDGRVAVALRDRGAIQLLDAGPTPESPLVPVCETAVPAEPVALGFRPADPKDAAGPSGRLGAGSLLVVSRWAAKLTALGLPGASGAWERQAERTLARDPVAVVVTGERAVVLHAVGGVVDDLPLTDLERGGSQGVARLATAPAPRGEMPGGPQGGLRVPRDRVGTQGYGLALDPATGRVFAALALAQLGGLDPKSWGRENTIVGEIAVLEPDGELRGSPFTSRADAADCQLPRSAAYDPERGLVLVACAGIDVLEAFDARADEPAVWGPYRKDARTSPLPAERRTPRQFPRWRAKVGAGPLAVAVDAKVARAWVWGAFDGTLTEVALDGRGPPPDAPRSEDLLRTDARRPRSTLRLREAPALPPAVALGRTLFHAGGPARRVAADGRACASCHLDGRDDGLTWFFSGEGPRQTPMLLGRLEGTAPFGWQGDEPLEGHVRGTLRRMSGIGLSTDERDAIVAYLGSLAAPRSDAAAGEQVARGAAVFASAEVGCATCHPAGAGVDGLQHDVRSRAPLDRASRFDTPSLRFVGRSAPYFHDGRHATLAAVLDGTSGTMGHTKQLSADDRAALLAFLESL